MKFDEIVYRACSLKDCAELSVVGSATFLEAFAGVLDREAIIAHCAKQHSIEAYEKYLTQPDCRAWLAEAREGAAPIGYAMLTRPDLPLSNIGPRDVELKRIYVFSRFYGKEAGQKLLDLAIAAALEMGMQRLLLGVYQENHRALAFYRKNGFSEAGSRKFTVGPNTYDDLILSRTV